MTQRRDVLKYLFSLSAISTLSIHSTQVFSMPQANNSKMLVVFLRGAYDGTNCLIPYSESFYYEQRPNIAVPRPDSTNPSSISLTADFALHPALKDSIYPLYQQKQIVFIPAAGQIDNSRSHFHAQDMMEYGYADNQGNYSNGFLNRFIESLNHNRMSVNVTSYTNNLPIILKGNVAVPNIALGGDIKSHINERQAKMYQDMYGDSALGKLINEGIETRKNISSQLNEEMKAANQGAISAKGFANQTHKIATLMKDSNTINVGFIDVGGWDTHVNQGASDGQYANNLKQLGEGLAEFKSTMGNQWQNTIVVVISEFGRTARENGNRGTDHGHGNVMWVLGGSINGGIKGDWNGFNATALHESRDTPVLNENRDILANIWQKMYGLNREQLNIIFPGFHKKEYNIV